MKRNFDARSLKSVLNKLIDKNSLSSGLNNVKVQSLWEKTMGVNVNSYTTEIYLKNKTLYVSLSSSVLRQELSYGKQKIIDLINDEIGANIINKIVLR
jgi:predicted nucleic acid-binding Zn ribbon protein